MPTAARTPRRFRSRERFQIALSDVYDGYGSADLAVWLPTPSTSLHLSESLPAARSRIVAAWPAPSGDVESGWVAPDEFQRWLAAEGGRVGVQVELANPDNEDVRSATTALGYSAEIAGQITGYWFEEDDVPASRPPYGPDGAILLLPDAANGGGRPALDLVRVGYEWRVLSHAAVLTYLHATGIRREERWLLCTFAPSGAPSTTYLVTGMDELSYAELQRLVPHAAERARDDQPAVLLKVREP